ncbi:MAG: glycosyl transferase family 39 [Candidatus Auribacterota bacterium]
MIHLKQAKWIVSIALILGLLVIIGISFAPCWRPDGTRNLYVYLADAFLHGRLWVPFQNQWDIARYEGRMYVVFPPFPAVLLMPVVAALGIYATSTQIITMLISVLNVYLFVRLFRRLCGRIDTIWLTLAFFAGTGYWCCMIWSDGVWYFAHIVAVMALFLLLNELFGKARGYLAGIFFCMAFLSRQLTIYYSIFALFMLWRAHKDKPRPYIHLIQFLAVSGLCVVIYMIYNYARFENFFDTGYRYIMLQGFGTLRFKKYGLFNAYYIPYNFYSYFIKGFNIVFKEGLSMMPLHMDFHGTSLFAASPFVLAAFRSKLEQPMRTVIWITAGLIAAHSLFYFNNGFRQINCVRFSLDYLPLVMVLVAGSVKSIPAVVLRGAIVVAIILNIIALFVVPVLF